MGILFTLLYVFTAYSGLTILNPQIAAFHIEILIAIVALLCTIPSLPESRVARIPQTYAILGLCFAVVSSMVASGWAGGAPAALMEFVPNALVFFFVVLNFRKKGHLQLIVLVLLGCALYTIFQGNYALQTQDYRNVYLEPMRNNDNVWFVRLRGMSFLNDPNDLAQFMVGLIPWVFIFWVKDRLLRNFIFVIVPVSVLFFGMYLTHSRGGMLALMVVAVVAGRKKLGLIPAVIAGGLLFIGLTVAGFAGGRDISMDSGADRMDAWAAGLKMIRAHPIFGVGFGRFTDWHNLTAHNTVVLCAAEIGLMGLFFWMLLMVPTVRDALVGSGKRKRAVVPEEEQNNAEPKRKPMGASVSRLLAGAGFGRHVEAIEVPGMLRGALATGPNSMAMGARTDDRAAVKSASTPVIFGNLNDEEYKLPDLEVQRLCSLALVSLSGFLAAGWFLSRAYTMSVFLYAGMTAVMYRIARNQSLAPPPMPILRAARAAAVACVVFIFIVYLFVRFNYL